MREVADREAERGHELPPERVNLLGQVLQALWWQRYTSFAAVPMTVAQVDRLVSDVLEPIIEPERALRSGR